MSEPKNPPEPREPTMDELLAEMHADELSFWKSGDGSPKQREEFLEGIKARWKAKQKPITQSPVSESPTSQTSEEAVKPFTSPKPEPPESKTEENTPVNSIPFPSPSEEELRRQRINQAYLMGKRPDPEDLAEEEADKARYQRKLAEAFEKKAKELSTEESSSANSRSKNQPTRTIKKRTSRKTRQPKQQSTTTLLEKLWRLTESNFFWGGGVGMVLVAYGFQLAGALKFSIALLVIGWAVITISIYRHNFFEGKSRRTQLIGQTIISAALAIALAVLWIYLQPTPTTKDNQITQLQPSPTPAPTPYAPVSIPVMSPQVLPTQQASPTPLPPSTESQPPTAFHFARQVPLKGGSAQRLSTLLTENGYKGPMLLQELTIRNMDDNEETLYIGQSDVNSTNGESYLPGMSHTWRVGPKGDIIDATQFYLFIPKSGKVGLDVRAIK